jgi:RNA polymerase sigma factor (sigma-70 family)
MRPARRHDLVAETLAAHGASVLSLARRHSLCADDAQDAYQRGVELFLRRAGTVSPDRAASWLRTVVKREALDVRAARLRLVGPHEADLDRAEARHLPGAEERAIALDARARRAEALSRIKPNEARALVLKAHGYSYREIGEITGWTYTKVNRCLTEGRRAARERYADIESGRECDRWSLVLAALAAGTAGFEDVRAVRPHLRRCPACRARVRGRAAGVTHHE